MGFKNDLLLPLRSQTFEHLSRVVRQTCVGAHLEPGRSEKRKDEIVTDTPDCYWPFIEARSGCSGHVLAASASPLGPRKKKIKEKLATMSPSFPLLLFMAIVPNLRHSSRHVASGIRAGKKLGRLA